MILRLRIIGWVAMLFLLLVVHELNPISTIKNFNIPKGIFFMLGILMLFYYGNRLFIQYVFRHKLFLVYFLISLVQIILTNSLLLFISERFVTKTNTGFWDILFSNFTGFISLVQHFNTNTEELGLEKLSDIEGGVLVGNLFLLFLLMINFQVTITKHWFKSISTEEKLADTENAFLKTQLNPHLFKNMLNNIYALVALKKDEALNAIEKLQTFMEYMLYKSNSQRVPLEMEIEYIKDLLEIEHYRLPENFKVEFNISGSMENKYIAPLVLLPFVENIFSHGDLHSQDAFISLNLEIKKNELTYTVRNKIPENSSQKETGGIGLKNLENRLEITYPFFMASLSKKTKNNIYEAKMKIFDLSNHVPK